MAITQSRPWSGHHSVVTEDPRLAFIQDDIEALELYNSIVLEGVLSPDEFWEAREHELRDARATLDQRHGLSTGLTANVHTKKTSQVAQQVELSDEQIDRIFLAYPKVDALYREKVLLSKELSPQEFWILYFYSKYNPENHLHGPDFQTKDKVIEASQIFGYWDEEEDDDIVPRVKSLNEHGSYAGVRVDNSVNLLMTLSDNPHGTQNELAGIGMANRSSYGIAQRDAFAEKTKDEKTKKALHKLGRKVRREDLDRLMDETLQSSRLFSHYNQHGSTVLPDETGNSQKIEKRLRRLEEEEKLTSALADISDVKEIKNNLKPVHLNVHVNSYMFVGGKEKEEDGNGESFLPQIKSEYSDLSKWIPNESTLMNVMPNSETSKTVLSRVIGMQKKGFAVDLGMCATSLDDVSDSDELLRLTRSCNELRRHFWKNFPPHILATDDFRRQDSFIYLAKIVVKLDQFEERVRAFRAYARNSSNKILANLLHDLLEQIKKSTDNRKRSDWCPSQVGCG